MTLMDGTPVPTVDLGSVKGPIVAVWQRHRPSVRHTTPWPDRNGRG